MTRIQTETRTEMMCLKDILDKHCKDCSHDISCQECNINNITFELIDLSYGKPVERWDFSK